MAIPELNREIERRRTLAIISHPDAGKTTMTEKLLLYSGAIQRAGNVSLGTKGATTSDWMEIEQQRGISVSSSAMRVAYDDKLLNILDTPGHQDFSEDTYRTLMAVDSAIMILDAAKGVEPQTIKLFKVCRDRGIPIITFINKLDRPALNPFELLDNVEKVLGITTVPMSWPVGDGPDFRGIYERREKKFHLFQRTAGGKHKAPVKMTDMYDTHLQSLLGSDAHRRLIDDLHLIDGTLPLFDRDAFLKEKITPVFFGSALNNFGVENFLQYVLELAPTPQPVPTSIGPMAPENETFSCFVYKVQANMNKAHRDRLSFVRIVSGKFERGMTVRHFGSNKDVKLNYPFQVFGRERTILDEAYPGDVIGLINPGTFRIGDVLSAGAEFTIPRFPRFAPEIFVRVRPSNNSYSKGFRKGIEQLGEEGVVQVFAEPDGSLSPLLAAVGELQLQVFSWRMENEYNEKVVQERLPYTRTRWVGNDVKPAIDVKFAYDDQQRPVLLLKSDWELNYLLEKTPGLILYESPPREGFNPPTSS